jgi:transposase
MPRPLTIINQEVVKNALLELKNFKEIGVVSNRLKAIISANQNGIKTVCEVFDTNPSSLHRWVVRFKKYGVKGLMKIKKNQNRYLLKELELTWLKQQIENNPNCTAKTLQKMIFEKFKIEISSSAIYNYIKKLGFSHITARPTHYKQDKEKLEDFKKNSNSNQRKKSK